MALTQTTLTELGWDEGTIAEWLRDAPHLELEHARRWRDLGLSAEDAARYELISPTIAGDWQASGFTPAEMVRCHRSHVTLRRAVEWRDAGRDMDQTIAWASFGFGPAEADHWLGRGLDATSAHQIRQLGGRGGQPGLVAFVVGVSTQEPIDVPEDARDLEQELAEMLPHVVDPASLPEPWRTMARRSIGGQTEDPAH